MARAFGCVISSFPQTYLGLPLSTHKLRLADFAPIVLKSDMRLSDWRGRSLPIGGRLLLVNYVLTSMLAHAMNAGLLLTGVIEAIDKRRRAFLWTGKETCNDGQCKVAWTDVCVPKKYGGWGYLSTGSKLRPSCKIPNQVALYLCCSFGLLGSAIFTGGLIAMTWVITTSLTPSFGRTFSPVSPTFASSPKSPLGMEASLLSGLTFG